MTLPKTLPADPDMLEALYTLVVASGNYSQEEFDRLMEARLRSWGVEPMAMSAEQMLAAMQESVNRLLLNLQHAHDSASNDAYRFRFGEVIQIAQQLRDHIDQAAWTLNQA